MNKNLENYIENIFSSYIHKARLISELDHLKLITTIEEKIQSVSPQDTYTKQQGDLIDYFPSFEQMQAEYTNQLFDRVSVLFENNMAEVARYIDRHLESPYKLESLKVNLTKIRKQKRINPKMDRLLREVLDTYKSD